MAGNQQKKAAARRHLDRQLAARAAAEARRRRVAAVAIAVGVVVLLVLGGAFLIATSGEQSTDVGPSAGSSSAPGDAARTAGPCAYVRVDATGSPNLRDVGLPPDPKPPSSASRTVRFTTNRGVIEAELDGKHAPCNVQAVSYLIHRSLYDHTPCPRVVSGGLNIVQCGSGTDTNSGGPTFTVPSDDNAARVTINMRA